MAIALRGKKSLNPVKGKELSRTVRRVVGEKKGEERTDPNSSLSRTELGSSENGFFRQGTWGCQSVYI